MSERSAAYLHEPQTDGRVIVRHPVKREWSIICQPEEIERAEALITDRWRKMVFMLGMVPS